jgi:hypothetical protein
MVGKPPRVGGTYVVCSPVRLPGPPRVPSRITSCLRCGQGVWLSNRADRDARCVCVVCAMSIVRAGDLVSPAPWVAADLAELTDPLDEL